jgi:ADP-heptose:LPS heptosyltransferase
MKTKFSSLNSPKSYAIFVRSSFGDLLMVDPLIKYIKELNLENKIDLFVEVKIAPLVEFMEHINNYYSLPSKGNKYFFFTYFGLKFRKNKYDISIAAKTGTGSANGYFQFMLGASKKISYVSKPNKWTDKLINCPIDYKEEIYDNQHYALSVLNLLNPNLQSIDESLFPKLININKSQINSNPRILISLSNNRNSCLLKNIKIASIFNKLFKEFKFEAVISVLKTDHHLALDLKNQLNLKSTIYLTPILRDYLKLIKSVDICFLGEGGSMHMAAALGVPQVVLFGETSKVTWSPLSLKATVIKDKSNVNNIPEEVVFETLKSKLIELKI